MILNRSDYVNAGRCFNCRRPIPEGEAVIVRAPVRFARGEPIPGVLACNHCRTPHGDGEGSRFEGSGERVIRSTRGLA